ncbi:KATNB1-like protein 1 isoform X2 [Platichthys flesus]|uniref:KATNB1-like protein 1 isoform X2 n=1 Tax=Platichthys flesus TaxID=8260 RepID=UPI002DBD481A|nr:KATNB1-like protein 1 isoform X2 [Platichthys flesus]
MKQVDIINKDELDKERFQVHYGARSPGAAKLVASCKRKGGPQVEVGAKLHRRTSDVGRVRDPGMANKENELTCPDDVRGLHYNDICGLPVSSAEASKMAGASSKYSDFAELSKDHEAMTHILFGRNLRLQVAKTLWRRNASELVAYLIRFQDTGVLLDCLPVLTKEHIMVGLHWVQSVIKKWWSELSKNEKRLQDSCSEVRNIEVMKQRLKDVWKDGARLCLIPGSTGELAKAIEASLSQLP